MKVNHKHLTYEQRLEIQSAIHSGFSKTQISKITGKHITTIAREISIHRRLKYKCKMKLECSNYKTCKHGRVCHINCPDYIEFKCKRRDKSPGACNGCDSYHYCRFNKFKYEADFAHKQYKEVLVDSREGVDLTVSEAKVLGDRLKKLIDQGHSVYQILNDNPDINLSEKTIYNYIDQGVFRVSNLLNIDLRQKTSRIRKIPKDAKYKKRADRKYLIGRKYEDYLKFIEENPSLTIVQMDTVYNDITNGPFIQTFKFINTGFIFALYRKEKTSLSMTQGVYTLYEILGQDVFREQVNIILTDNGPEFYDALNMECFAGFQQTRLFYCDPMMSGQKGSLENKHKELRYILPKKVSLIDLGLKHQESLSLVLSHVNSASLKSLGNKSSLELMQFMFPNMYKALLDYGIKMIPKDEIILKPNLLNQFR